jgi:hypothetical protein
MSDRWYRYMYSQGLSPDSLDRTPRDDNETKLLMTAMKNITKATTSGNVAALKYAMNELNAGAKLIESYQDNMTKLATTNINSYTDLAQTAMKTNADAKKALLKHQQAISAAPSGPRDKANAAMAAAHKQGVADQLSIALNVYTTEINRDPVLAETQRQSLPVYVNDALRRTLGFDLSDPSVEKKLESQFAGHPNAQQMLEIVSQAKSINHEQQRVGNELRSLIGETDAMADAFIDKAQKGGQPAQAELQSDIDRMEQMAQGGLRSIAYAVSGSEATNPAMMQLKVDQVLKQIDSIRMQEDFVRENLNRGAFQGRDKRDKVANAIMNPQFRAWAEDNGLEHLGNATFDENGRVTNYVIGQDDSRALLLFNFQMKHPQRYGQLFKRGGASHTQEAIERVRVDVPATPEMLAKYNIGEGETQPKFAYIEDVENGSKRFLSAGEYLDYQESVRGDSGIRASTSDAGTLLYNADAKQAVFVAKGSNTPMPLEWDDAFVSEGDKQPFVNMGGVFKAPETLQEAVAASTVQDDEGFGLVTSDDPSYSKAERDIKADRPALSVKLTAKPPGSMPIYGYKRARHAGWNKEVPAGSTRIRLPDGTEMDVPNDQITVTNPKDPTVFETMQLRRDRRIGEQARADDLEKLRKQEAAIKEGDPDEPSPMLPPLKELDDPMGETGMAAVRNRIDQRAKERASRANALTRQRVLEDKEKALDKFDVETDRQVDKAFDKLDPEMAEGALERSEFAKEKRRRLGVLKKEAPKTFHLNKIPSPLGDDGAAANALRTKPLERKPPAKPPGVNKYEKVNPANFQMFGQAATLEEEEKKKAKKANPGASMPVGDE